MEIKARISSTGEDIKPNETAYDISQGIEAIKQFIRRTKPFTKAFKKLTKKMNGADSKRQIKENTKFSKKNLFPVFKTELEKVFFKRNEIDFLDERAINTYTLGCFIAGNSQEPNIKNGLEKIYAKVLVEICERSQENRISLEENRNEGK